MLVATVLAARWVVGRLSSPAPAARLGVGLVALGFLFVAEFTVSLWLRGLTFREYVANRDPVAGGGVHRDARRFCRDAASRGSKMRSPLRSGSCEPGIRFPVVMLIDTYLPKFDARGYYETHVDYPCDS
jgi:hypothetical protein